MEMLGLDVRPLQQVMNAHEIDGSHMMFWRAVKDSSRNLELQAEMRAVFESLGIVFYEREGVGFHEENMPSKKKIERLELPEPLLKAFKRLRRREDEPETDEDFDELLDLQA